LICQKGIDDLAQHFLSKEGIYAVRRAKKSDMDKLAKATGAIVVANLDELSPKDLGFAGNVEEQKIGDDKMTFITDCKNPKAVSILIRGSTEHVVDELERGMHDALFVVKVALEDGKITPGGGAAATTIAMALRDYASSVGGREQMAIETYANAVEIIPKTLAENAGLDPIDMMIEMRRVHKNGNKNAGIDVFTGKVVDMIKSAKLGEPKKYTIQIENIVASAKLPSRLNLDKIAFELENSEYEPEQFPGLVYRMKDPKAAFLLFSSGKVVCTGVRKVEDIESSVKTIIKRLNSVGALKN